MSESERPKPQYGEYASDEEYASALERSGVDPQHAQAPAPPSSDTSPSATHRAPHVPSSRTPPRKGSFDRIVTFFLLSFGIVSILGSASSYLNLAETLQDTVARLGMGEYHPTEQTAAFGIAMLASQVILWVVAAVWSYRRMSRHQRAWWVPVLAGGVAFIVLTVLLGAVLAGDPSLVPALSKL